MKKKYRNLFIWIARFMSFLSIVDSFYFCSDGFSLVDVAQERLFIQTLAVLLRGMPLYLVKNAGLSIHHMNNPLVYALSQSKTTSILWVGLSCSEVFTPFYFARSGT
jgi:hypothetical protein